MVTAAASTEQKHLGEINLRQVWDVLRPQLVPATILTSDRLDEMVGHGIRLHIVADTFQHTGSFKFRAALCLALHAPSSRILTASSGNFGAALARACRQTGKECTVVMPAKSAAVKVENVRRYGGTVDLVDTDRMTRAERVAQLHAQDPSFQVVSAYDDPFVIAGNSSLGAELFESDTYDCVVVAVGGGGLSSGLVVARDQLGSRSEVIGAEPAAGKANRSLQEDRIVTLEREPATIADGARTLSLGTLNFAILREGLEAAVPVEDATIGQSVRLLFEAVNLKAEPTGALGLGAVLQNPERFAGRSVACVVTGGNVDAAVFAKLITG
jgi:threonine dehydratase